MAMEILTRLTLEPQTSGELADAMGIDAEVVRQQLRKLRRAGQAERVGSKSRRGRPEHVYSVDLHANILPPEDLDGLPKRAVDEADLALLRMMFREAADAIEAGTFASRPDRVMTRIAIPLDERAFREADALHRRLLSEVIDEVERAATRLAEGGKGLIHASAHILLFEYPAERWPPPSPDGEPVRRSAGGDSVEKLLESIDPPRRRLLDALAIEPASAGEVAARLGEPSTKVRYELERLLAAGSVKVIERRQSRGTAERIFVTDPRTGILTTEDITGQPGRRLEAFNRWVVRTVFAEALDAIRVETPRSLDEVVIARLPMAIDSEGFAAVSALLEAGLRELFALRERSLERLGADDAKARLGISGLFLFERVLVQRNAA